VVLGSAYYFIMDGQKTDRGNYRVRDLPREANDNYDVVYLGQLFCLGFHVSHSRE
jgi:hypothetical protein